MKLMIKNNLAPAGLKFPTQLADEEIVPLKRGKRRQEEEVCLPGQNQEKRSKASA
jgi:hypothetical protein